MLCHCRRCCGFQQNGAWQRETQTCRSAFPRTHNGSCHFSGAHWVELGRGPTRCRTGCPLHHSRRSGLSGAQWLPCGRADQWENSQGQNSRLPDSRAPGALHGGICQGECVSPIFVFCLFYDALTSRGLLDLGRDGPFHLIPEIANHLPGDPEPTPPPTYLLHQTLTDQANIPPALNHRRGQQWKPGTTL